MPSAPETEKPDEKVNVYGDYVKTYGFNATIAEKIKTQLKYEPSTNSSSITSNGVTYNCQFRKLETNDNNATLFVERNGNWVVAKFNNNGELDFSGEHTLDVAINSEDALQHLNNGNGLVLTGINDNNDTFDKVGYEIADGDDYEIAKVGAVQNRSREGKTITIRNKTKNETVTIKANQAINRDMAERIADKFLGMSNDAINNAISTFLIIGSNNKSQKNIDRKNAIINELLSGDRERIINALTGNGIKLTNDGQNNILGNIKEYAKYSNVTIEKHIENITLSKSSDVVSSVHSTNPTIDDFLKRLKKKQTVSGKSSVRVTKAQEQAAEDWFNKSGLKSEIKLEGLQNQIGVDEHGNPDKDVLARFTWGLIELYQGSDKTDIYHEAFHGLFEMFLTDKDRNELYAELRTLDREFTDKHGKKKNLKNATNAELDEVLAEGFRVYMLTGNIPYYSRTDKVKSLFVKSK